MTDIVANMEALARKWHEGAYRRGPEHLPYIVHPAAVVGMLKEWGYNETEDAVTLAVGWGTSYRTGRTVVAPCRRRR